jgi:methionine synthase II (cobalamin-independent)
VKPRHGANVDGNHPAIVQALKDAGAKVTVLDLPETEEAKGEPDLLVAWCGALSLIEVKARKGKLSEAQKRKHAEYARVGIRVHTVRSEREALDAIGATGAKAEERMRDMRSMAAVLDEAKSVNVGRGRLRPAVRRYGAGEAR